MASLGIPVALAALALQGWRHGCGREALPLAAALAESPQGERDSTDHMQRGRQRPATKRLLKRLQTALSKKVASGRVLTLDAVLLRVFRDRVAVLSDHRDNRYRLSTGTAAFLPDQDRLSGSQYLVVFALAGAGRVPRITRARQLDLESALAVMPELIDHDDVVSWDTKREQVVAERRQGVGAITLRVDPLPQADDEAVCAALVGAVRERGLGALQWGEAERQLQSRVALLAQLDGGESGIPAFDDTALLAHLEHWLGPQLMGVRRLADCRRIAIEPLLLGLLDWPIRERLEALLPTRIRVPSGRLVALNYSAAGATLEVKLQELFGMREGPRLAGGRVAVTVHLLSPARRPVAVTRDLESFWNNGYHDVRKQMRGRYPKHPWPEDPLTAEPTAYTKSRAAGKGGRR